MGSEGRLLEFPPRGSTGEVCFSIKATENLNILGRQDMKLSSPSSRLGKNNNAVGLLHLAQHSLVTAPFPNSRYLEEASERSFAHSLVADRVGEHVNHSEPPLCLHSNRTAGTPTLVCFLFPCMLSRWHILRANQSPHS